ncbi:MAG: DEAD/DEAH box helicase [Bdellovibrionota bacterium]
MAVIRLEKLILRYPQSIFLGKGPGLATPKSIELQKPNETFSNQTLRTRLSDIPTQIYSKWLNRIVYHNSSKDDYFESIFFVFSDGQVISLLSLPLAPQAYLNALPTGIRWPDLIQALRGSETSEANLLWMSHGPSDLNLSPRRALRLMLRKDPSYRAFDSLMTAILKHFSEKTFFRDLELGIGFIENNRNVYYPVSKVEISEDPFYDVKISRAASEEALRKYIVDFQLKNENADLKSAFFCFNSESGILKIHANAKSRLMSAFQFFDKLISNGRELTSESQFENLRFESANLMDVANVLELDANTIKLSLPPEEVSGKAIVNCSNDLKEFQVRLDLPERNGTLANFGHLSNSMLKNAEEGLRTFIPEQGKFLITPRRGRQREEEMKLLRHQGCALLLIYETCLYVSGKDQTSGERLKSDEAFIEYIFQRWQIVINSKAEKQVPSVWNRELVLTLKTLVIQVVGNYRRKIPHFDAKTGDALGTISSCEAQLSSALIELSLRIHGNSILSKQKTLSLKDFFLIEDEKILQWHPFESPLKGLHRCKLNDDAIGWQLVPFLKNNGFEIEFNGVPLAELTEHDLRGVISIRATPSDDESYFSLNPSVYFMGKIVNPGELIFDGSGEFLRYRNEIYFVQKKNLPGVRSLMAFWQRLTVGKEKEQSFLEGKYVQLPRHGMLDVLAMANQGVKLELDEDSGKLLDYYRNLGKQSVAVNEVHSQIELKPYQLIGIQWIWDLYQMGLGGILSDEMGLGKTAQVLGFFELLKKRSSSTKTPNLIIVPTSLLHNWTYEAKRFFPDLDLRILGSGKDIRTQLSEELNSTQIFVSTYGLMYEHRDILLGIKWNVVVFDEAHQLKNIVAQRTGVARQLKSRFKLAMTGTPLENNLIEFYSLFDLILPRGLGSLGEFRKLYVEDYSLFRAAQMEHLRLRSKPVLMRRTKQSVHLELPAKIETLVPLEMEKKQKDLYRRIAMQFNSEVLAVIDRNGEASAQLHMLSALMRLRQICSHPGVLESVNYSAVPPKLEYLLTMLPDIIDSGESVLIFTQFRKTMDLILPQLKKIGPTYNLHGGMSSDERRKTLNEFSGSDKASILLMTLKTGGVGLNLTKATYVFHLEPWWNPAAEDQATDRAHRLGQTKAVNVYRLLMQDSLEERIQEMKARKQKMYSALLDEDYSENMEIKGSQGLTKDDFSYLIGNLKD